MHLNVGTIAQYTTENTWPKTTYFIITERFQFTSEYFTVWTLTHDYGNWSVETKTLRSDDTMFEQARPVSMYLAQAVMRDAKLLVQRELAQAKVRVLDHEHTYDRLTDIETMVWQSQQEDDEFTYKH